MEVAWGVGAGLGRIPSYMAQWLDRDEDDLDLRAETLQSARAAQVRTNQDESEGRGSLQSHA